MKLKEWTIMIYMAGDNNLAVDMAYAMEQIKGVAAAGADSPNLFVYYDGNSPAIPTLYCDFSEAGKARYVRSYKVPNKLYKATKKPNENAADIFSIINFVDWCVNKVEVENKKGEITYGRPAQKYALIFSGHSLGFQDIGLFKDESTGKSLKMDDFLGALRRLTWTQEDLEADADEKGLEGEDRQVHTTKLLGQPLDILGFDSCVMGMLEVGYQFSDVAHVLIASEGSVPSAGWTYAKILGCLAAEDNRNVDTRLVGDLFVRKFIESQDSYTVGGVSVDMAAWDLAEFGALTAAFDELSQSLIDCFNQPEDSVIYRQMERVILQVHWYCQSYMFDQNVDLGDFCELLYTQAGMVADELVEGLEVKYLREELQPLCLNVLEALKNAVILSGFSGGGYQYSNGVSVFFPWSRAAYEVSKKNYESLWFAKYAKQENLKSWADFLKKFLYEVTYRKSAPTNEEVEEGMRYRYASGVRFDERYDTGLYLGAAAGAGSVKIAGQENTKIAGQENTKIAGQENTKIAGQENTKIAGQENTKIAGQENTKIAGQENTKLAGGGAGSNRFFDSLKLFKNVESRWDVSGFTKKRK
jgi:hypothetical protein